MAEPTKDALVITNQIATKQVRISYTFSMEKKLLSMKFIEEAGFIIQKEVLYAPNILFVNPSQLDFVLKTLNYKSGFPNAKIPRFDNARFHCQWKNLLIYVTETVEPSQIFVFHYNTTGIDYIEKEDSTEKDKQFEIVLNKDRINTVSCAVAINLT